MNAIPNDTRYDDFKAVVRELGRDAAAGKDSLPNLAVVFARAVADGVLDVAPDAAGKDGASRAFDLYATSAGKKAVHERTENGLKANVSKLRQIGKAAGNPKYDFVDVLNRAIIQRRDAEDNGLEVKPAYAAYVDVAREQLKHDDALEDEHLKSVVIKGDNTREVTVEGELKRAAKILENLITGEAKHGLKDNSPEVMTAAEQINTRLAALLTKAKMEDALNKALEAGVISQEEFDARVAA